MLLILGVATRCAVQPINVPRSSTIGSKGMVRGEHFTQHVETIKRLMREKQDEEALALLLECARATSRQSKREGFGGGGGAPWYVDRAATILHRKKDYATEVRILRTFLEAEGDFRVHAGLEQKLRRAEEHLDALKRADDQPACPACGSVLHEWPTANAMSCPDCGADLLIRKISGKRELITRDEEARRLANNAYRRDRNKLLKVIGPFGVTEAEFTAGEEADPTGGLPAAYLRALNLAAERARSRNDWRDEHRTRVLAGEFSADAGEPWWDFAVEAERLFAEGHFDGVSPEQLIYIQQCSCPICRTTGRRMMTVQEYRVLRPLPHRECELPPCRCTLGYVGDVEFIPELD